MPHGKRKMPVIKKPAPNRKQPARAAIAKKVTPPKRGARKVN